MDLGNLYFLYYFKHLVWKEACHSLLSCIGKDSIECGGAKVCFSLTPAIALCVKRKYLTVLIGHQLRVSITNSRDIMKITFCSTQQMNL